MKRRAAKRSGSKSLTVWVPKALLLPLDQGVKREDSERSKFIRDAVCEKLARDGVTVETETGR